MKVGRTNGKRDDTRGLPIAVAAGRRLHENLFTGRVALAVWAALIVPPFALIAAPPAAAQITAGPGQSVSVLPNITITCTNCVALNAPGGTITAPVGTFFTLNVFSNAAFAAGAFVPANTGGRIALNDGTINNTTTAGGIGATGVLSQAGGLITGTNVNINGNGFQSTALEAQGGGQIIWTGRRHHDDRQHRLGRDYRLVWGHGDRERHDVSKPR